MAEDAAVYLTVTRKQDGWLPQRFIPLLGRYKATSEGGNPIFKSESGTLLYFEDDYWYFDTESEEQIAWVQGDPSKVPTGSWSGSMQSVFFSYHDNLPIAVGVQKPKPVTPTSLGDKAYKHYKSVRDVHAPYVKQKTGELAIAATEHAHRCHGCMTHPDTPKKVKETCCAYGKLTLHGCTFCLAACILGLVKCLDKSLIICLCACQHTSEEKPSPPTSSDTTPQAKKSNAPTSSDSSRPTKQKRGIPISELKPPPAKNSDAQSKKAK
mmetsp:Transcript_49389/g.89397  ORF Transcript_49389/g.89397 Transcript_49389/m.89397 type:complete len:267 (-) Transcript_49389:32-832(-)